MSRRIFYRALVMGLFVLAAAGPVAVRGEDEVATPADRYAVPEGDVAAILKFLKRLETYRPTTTTEILTHKQHARQAFQTAVERIIQLEPDKKSDAYRKAISIQLQLRLADVPGGTAESRRSLYEDIQAHVKSAKQISLPDVQLAYTFGQVLERVGEVDSAKEAYREFGKIISASEIQDLAEIGKRMTGIARRLDLPGKEMTIEGTTASGEPFDWKAYRGKVVLVDYWATWCAPCIEELPNVKENYDRYHDQGFDVVAISLDANAGRVRRFLAEREIPWVCLVEEGESHPMADYYGVMAIPSTILVDRDGKVARMDVYGGELGRELAKLLGAPTKNEGTTE